MFLLLGQGRKEFHAFDNLHQALSALALPLTGRRHPDPGRIGQVKQGLPRFNL